MSLSGLGGWLAVVDGGGAAGLGGDETRSAAFSSLPDSSYLRAAGGWLRENTHQGVWLWKVAAALQPKRLTSEPSSFLAARICVFSPLEGQVRIFDFETLMMKSVIYFIW